MSAVNKFVPWRAVSTTFRAERKVSANAKSYSSTTKSGVQQGNHLSETIAVLLEFVTHSKEKLLLRFSNTAMPCIDSEVTCISKKKDSQLGNNLKK